MGQSSPSFPHIHSHFKPRFPVYLSQYCFFHIPLFQLICIPGNCILVLYYSKQKYFLDMYSCALEPVTFKGQ